MFAYCNNNPLNNSDSKGSHPYNINVNMTDSGPLDEQNKARIRARKEHNLYYNEDEQKVLDASLFAFYKGRLCIKLPIGENAFSFGVMFIGNNVGDRRDCINTVRHECGHTVQFGELGVIGYLFNVAIPSVVGYWADLPYTEYFSQPWEYGADKAGGVVNRIGGYNDDAEANWAAWWASLFS